MVGGNPNRNLLRNLGSFLSRPPYPPSCNVEGLRRARPAPTDDPIHTQHCMRGGKGAEGGGETAGRTNDPKFRNRGKDVADVVEKRV